MKNKQFCYWCGVRPASTRDHLVPKSRGGTNEINNIVWACDLCNSEKSNKLKYKGKDLYKLAKIQKPAFVVYTEKTIRDLRKMRSFQKFYDSLDEGNKDYIFNCIANNYDNNSKTTKN